MMPEGRPTMFTVKRDKHYCEPFGENWDEVLSRLTPNQINFVGNEYGHLRHQINENYAELTTLRSELERVREENRWHVFADEKPATEKYYEVLTEDTDFSHDYFHADGTWLSQYNMILWREIGELPTAPEEG